MTILRYFNTKLSQLLVKWELSPEVAPLRAETALTLSGIRMNKRRVFTFALSAVFLVALASSARADSVHLPPGLEKFNLPEGEMLSLLNLDQRGDLSGFIAEHFADNNGKHLGFVNSLGKATGFTNNSVATNNGRHVGFSVAALKGGVTFGLTPQRPDINVVENPEPTGMILLGTGLAAVAGFARKRSRRRRGL